MKYAKLVNGEIEFAPVNKGSIINYNLDIDSMLSDGYKPFEGAEKPTTDRNFEIKYFENSEKITEVINYLESEEAYQKRKSDEKILQEIETINKIINCIDSKRIRAICEPSVKDEESGQTWLEYYNAQILELREKLQTLQERIDKNDITE